MRLGASRERRGQPDRLRDAVARHEVRAEDRRGIEQRDLRGGLGRREQLGAREAPRPREPEPPLQLPHPFGRRRHLDPADPVPSRLAVELERPVQGDRVLRDPAHRPRGVRLEDEPGRVRGRPTRLEQRTLVEDEDVGRTELGQVVRGARADHPGADDDGLRPLAHQDPEVRRRRVRRRAGGCERCNLTRRRRAGGGRAGRSSRRSRGTRSRPARERSGPGRGPAPRPGRSRRAARRPG